MKTATLNPEIIKKIQNKKIAENKTINHKIQTNRKKMTEALRVSDSVKYAEYEKRIKELSKRV